MSGFTVTTLEGSGAGDAILSADGTKLYVSINGDIDVFDLASHAKIATWHIGTSVSQLTLSEDGSFLLAADPRQPFIYRVSTETGLVTGTYSGTGNAYTDIEIVNSNTALLS